MTRTLQAAAALAFAAASVFPALADNRTLDGRSFEGVFIQRGKTSGEIASILGIAKRTVDFHAEGARAKLGVANRIEAVVKAAAGGIILP